MGPEAAALLRARQVAHDDSDDVQSIEAALAAALHRERFRRVWCIAIAPSIKALREYG